MNIMELDEGRLEYMWTPFAEQTYQHLMVVDKLEWRYYHPYANEYWYYTFHNDGIVLYRVEDNSMKGFARSTEERVLADLAKILNSRRDYMMRKLSSADFEDLQKGVGCRSWYEFDHTRCTCDGVINQCSRCPKD